MVADAQLTEELFRLAEWEHHDGTLVEQLRSSWLNAHFSLLLDLLRCQSGLKAATALTALKDFNSESIVRLLLAPSIGYSLRTSNTEGVICCILAEHAVSVPNGAHLSAWTARGDLWLGKDTPSYVPDNVLRSDARGFRVPHLRCGIPIDLSISTPSTVPTTGLTNPLMLSSDEIFQSIGVLNKALEILRNVSHEAFLFFTAFTQNLVLRSSQADRDNLRSGSSPAALGRIVLVNVNCPSVVHHEVAESLLHESIHIALSCFELSQPLVHASETQPTIISPWTGSGLHPHAFVHACFVWFSLARFWQCRAEPYESVAWIENRLESIMKGFLSPKFDVAAKTAAPFLTRHGIEIVTLARQNTLGHAML